MKHIAAIPSTAIKYSHSYGLAFDKNDVLYASAFNANQIWKIYPNGTYSVFASVGMNQPWRVALDSVANVYMGNSQSGTVIKITPAGVVSTYATVGGGS